jgi:hypothetical protein
MRKTWREKLNPTAEPHVSVIPKPFMGKPAGSRLLIATPLLVKSYIESIPYGEIRTQAQLRDDLAHAHGADLSCPTSSGIFVRIVSEVAMEELGEGKSFDEVTPFWRVVDPDSPAAQKLSCGPDFIRERRKAER